MTVVSTTTKPGARPPPKITAAASFGAPQDDDFGAMKALIIDDKDVSRMTVSGVLRDIGIGKVKTVHGPVQARSHLKENTYDVILCEYHFSGAETGQDLLDDIRSKRLVPFNTIFFMVTGEAIYDRVASVVENAPDDYLLKPFKPSTLEERLNRALNKKIALLPIWTNIEEKSFEHALTRCKIMVRDRHPFWLDAARIGAELSMHLKRHKEAQQMYDMVLEAKALPWAKLGVAQVALTESDTERARGSLESLVSESSAYVDAYDMLARVYFEEGDLGRALETLRRAVEATPSNVMRLQKLGSLAFLVGDPDEAETMLSKAYKLSQGNRDFDAQTVMLLMFLTAAKAAGNPQLVREAERYAGVLAMARDKAPEVFRYAAMARIAEVCLHALNGDRNRAEEGLRALDDIVSSPAADFETVLSLLILMSRLDAAGIKPLDAAAWTRRCARRHAISKTAVDLLSASLGHMKDMIEIVVQEHGQISYQINDAMARLLKDDADGTARRLDELARDTLNARVFSLAENLANKHSKKLSPTAQQLLRELRDFSAQYCANGASVGLARITANPRSRLPLEG